MNSVTMCDGCVAVLDGGKITVTIDTDRHSESFCRVQVSFSKSLSVSPVSSVGASAAHSRQRSPPATRTLGERKTCLQVAFLMGLPVKSAFALLLTRVTEPRTSKFMRLEV